MDSARSDFRWFPLGFRLISITLTARPSRPAKLDCPDRSDLPLRGHSGPIGLDFSAHVAPTRATGPAIIAIRLRVESKNTNHTFPPNSLKDIACRPQVDVQTVPKVVQSLPNRPHRAPKCSQMEPWDLIFLYFSPRFGRLRPTNSQGCFRHAIFTQKRPSGHQKPLKSIHFNCLKALTLVC